MTKPLYIQVAESIVQLLDLTDMMSCTTNTFNASRVSWKFKLEPKCSRSTFYRAMDYLNEQGLIAIFGSARTVTVYIYIPALLRSYCACYEGREV